MHRRAYLALCSSAAIGITGCAEEGTTPEPVDTPSQGSTLEPTPPQTTDEPTERQTPEPVVEAQVRTSSLEIIEGQYRTTAAVLGEIENTGDKPLIILNALAKFYNSADELLNTAFGQAMGVLPNEVWIPRLVYSGDGRKVERATLQVDKTSPIIQRSTLTSGGESLKVISSNLQIPADETALPRITAKIQNVSGGDIQRVRFIGKVYNPDGHLLSTSTDVVSSFGDGETWSVDTVAALSQERADQMAEHNVLLYYY